MSCLYKGIEYLGQIIGCYEIVAFDQMKSFPSGQTQQYWKVRCVHCQNEKSISAQKVLGSYQDGCSKCVRSRFSGTNSSNWKGSSKHVTGMYVSRLKSAARKRSIPFLVSREELDEIFQKQNGRCVYTGYDLSFETREEKGSASLDRIDSKKPYTKDNVQWVHKDINIIKWDLGHDQFISLCRTVTENQKE